MKYEFYWSVLWQYRELLLDGFAITMALFIASVTGGVLVAVAGGARILQLRANARRARTPKRR